MSYAQIYALIDPRISDPVLRIRYVGMTTKCLDRRLRVHLSEAKKYRKPYRKLKWIRSLLQAATIPQILGLDTVATHRAFDREVELIAHYRALGCRLVNSTDGGEGILNPSAEIRDKIAAVTRNVSLAERARRRAFMLGKKHSPEILAKMSAAKKGKPGPKASAATKEKLSRIARARVYKSGYRHTAEARAHMSVAQKNRPFRLRGPHSEETKRKLALAHTGDKSSSAKLTWDQVRSIRSEYASGLVTQASLCRRYNILSPGTMWSLIAGKTWIENKEAI